MSERDYRCIKCSQYQDQVAGETCGNPTWHTPNFGVLMDEIRLREAAKWSKEV